MMPPPPAGKHPPRKPLDCQPNVYTHTHTHRGLSNNLTELWLRNMAQEVMEKVVSIDARNNNNKKECYSIGSIVFSTPAEDPITYLT